MHDELKAIVAIFLKKPADSITEETRIGRNAIQGSVLIHRMYANLAKNGYKVAKMTTIQTFGDLLTDLGLSGAQGGCIQSRPAPARPAAPPVTLKKALPLSVGIDIQEISQLPVVSDYRTDDFYKQNFSVREIEYCVLQANPIASFAGKFAAKEAIVKACPALRPVPFKDIEILNDLSGAPQFRNFPLSISHSNSTVVAVAICYNG
ncbi:MAG: holo-ACP synthase [Fibrobacterota bacterium]